MKVKTALISVSDKAGLAEFAGELAKNGVKIISSGGTYEFLKKAGLGPLKVEDVTGFPEMLDGRVKTLHPNIHAGILAKRDLKHLQQLKKQGIGTIDLVVVNLYPFMETISKKGVSLEDAIENIDIGGPSLIRGAAKNHESVGVVVEPSQYPKVLDDLSRNGFGLSEKMRRELAVEAFSHTAFYDSMIASFLNEKFAAGRFPEKFTAGYTKKSGLRYGENPHQQAALYSDPLNQKGTIVDAKQFNGKELSFNNYLDANSALEIASGFVGPAAVIVKHNNPCGVAVAKTISEAFSKAYECDKASAFGGVICLNRECDFETAKSITSFFNEVVIAPGYQKGALEELKKKQNLRVLELAGIGAREKGMEFKQILGGLLAQERDNSDDSDASKWKNVNGIKASKQALADLEFAWNVAKRVRSNAIVLAKGGASTGIGVGQTSRVDSSENAIRKAGRNAAGSVLASDAFFPFRDSIELAAKAGIAAIAEPGGSVRDEEVIAAAKEFGIALYFTGVRHFRH